MLKNIEIEFWEYHYFKAIDFLLSQDLEKMILGLKSKDKIKGDWIEVFNHVDKKRQNSDFARGAERIYFWLFNQFGSPNSSPIGADLMFETHNAFVHINIKTAKKGNPSDYKGKIPIGENQTSYRSSHCNANLPYNYNQGKENEKLCLTYALNIIYDDESEDFKILAVILVSIPNGKLKRKYKEKIIGRGKNKGKSFRYEYKNSPFYEYLPDKPSRVRALYIDSSIDEKSVTTL